MYDDPLPRVIRIPAGEFVMGSTDGAEGEPPPQRGRVEEYFIGVYAVTNDEYVQFIRETGHPPPAVRELPVMVLPHNTETFQELSAPYEWVDGQPPPGRGRHPVTLVRYEDAVQYCAWLSARTGRNVRLPTGAEWEKAARGRLEGRLYPWGNDIDPTRANYLTDAAAKKARGTSPVGQYPPNGYELYDMAGNVWEWVSDTAEESGTMRIVRGGSWVTDDVRLLRCAYRHKVPADAYAYSIGFRIVIAG